MKIGIIGAGTVGGHLGRALTAIGHDVFFSSREPHSEKMQTLLAQCHGRAQVGSWQQALDFGLVVAVALRWEVLPNVLTSLTGWEGKIVIDTTNRFGGLDASRPGGSSADLAALLPQAQVVKAFNSIGAERYLDPQFGGQRAIMPYCGDDPQARQTVGQLIDELGFEALDMGGLSAAPMLQSLAQFWIALAYGSQGRNIAFGLLRR